MPHEVADIKDQFRRQLRDPEYPGSGDSSDSLIHNDDILIFMDEAQKEFCRHIDIFPDSTTYSISVVAGTKLYALDPRITRIRRGVLASNGEVLEAKTVAEMDDGYSTNDYGVRTVTDWETVTGSPKFLVTDVEFGMVQLVPAPVEDDTLNLSVYRLPLKDIYDGEELEIPDQYRRTLLLKMMAYAYSQHDVELFDEARALQYENMWLDKLSQIDRDVKRLNRGPQTVRYGGL
jgi:hypothetical protein